MWPEGAGRQLEISPSTQMSWCSRSSWRRMPVTRSRMVQMRRSMGGGKGASGMSAATALRRLRAGGRGDGAEPGNCEEKSRSNWDSDGGCFAAGAAGCGLGFAGRAGLDFNQRPARVAGAGLSSRSAISDEFRASAIEAVGLDVVGDGRGKQAGAWISGVQALAEFGGGDVLVHGGEEVDAAALRGGESEWREEGFGEREFGTADDDPLGEGEELRWRAPVAQREEAVGAGEDEEGCGGSFAGKRGERVDGVVGGAVGAGRVDVGHGEAGVGCGGNSEPGHFEAVGEGGGGRLGLEGLAANRGEEDAVERDGTGCRGSQCQMAAMNGVERAAEEGYAHSGHATAFTGCGSRSGRRDRCAA